MTDGAATPPIRFDQTAKGPLDGMRVLDLSRLVAGNMLSLQLGDFGADVIKIEPPEGDPLRAWRDGGEQLFWKTYSRNKMSVVLNLRHGDTARDALLRLVDTADVFIENYRPGTLEAMGLAPETLLARNPRLVIVRISGFGQTGPYSRQPGFGTLVEAMSGFADRTGFPDREPVLPPLALADMIAGLSGAMATVTALLARERGAGGQVIDLSLLEPIFSTLGPEAAIYSRTGTIKKRVGNGSNTSAPRNIYRCADGGYVALSGSTQAMAKRVFEVIGQPRDDRGPAIPPPTRTGCGIGRWSTRWWVAGSRRNRGTRRWPGMKAAGVTAGPVYNISDAMADPHFQQRQVLVEVEDRELGSLPVHNIVPRLSGTPGAWRAAGAEPGRTHRPGPLPSIGLDPAQVAALRADGGCA